MTLETDHRNNQPDSQPEQGSGDDEQETLPPTIEEELLRAAEEMGFVENATLKQLRETVTPEMSETEALAVIAEYQRVAQELTMNPVDKADAGDALGALLAGAAVILQAGRVEHTISELETVITYAQGMGELNLVDYITSINDDLLHS